MWLTGDPLKPQDTHLRTGLSLPSDATTLPSYSQTKTKHSKWFHLFIIKNLLKISNMSDDILGAGTDMKKNKTPSLHLKTRTGDVFMTSTFDKVEECDRGVNKNQLHQEKFLRMKANNQKFQMIWELSLNALRQCFSRFRKHESHLEGLIKYRSLYPIHPPPLLSQLGQDSKMAFPTLSQAMLRFLSWKLYFENRCPKATVVRNPLTSLTSYTLSWEEVGRLSFKSSSFCSSEGELQMRKAEQWEKGGIYKKGDRAKIIFSHHQVR